jgi:hypothetical protein
LHIDEQIPSPWLKNVVLITTAGEAATEMSRLNVKVMSNTTLARFGAVDQTALAFKATEESV